MSILTQSDDHALTGSGIKSLAAGEPSKPKKRLRAALRYAKRGFPVFPVEPRGKRPLTPHGFKDATANPVQLAEWWNRWPNANIGIPTGSASGLLVLDIDPRSGGNESLERLIEAHGPLPDTTTQTTGGGGRHLIFKYVEGVRSGVLADGIDVKAEGGYIVVAPSIHQSGNRYRWDVTTAQLANTLLSNVSAGAESLLSPANLPKSFLTLVKRADTTGGATVILSGDPIPEGRRNDWLTSMAGKMRHAGFMPEAIEAALIAENRNRCTPPLPEAEARGIANSVARYEPGARQPRESIIENLPNIWEFEQKLEWTVQGIIVHGTITMFTGDSGVGKATLVLAIAGAVAHGEMILGKAVSQLPVLYVDRENGLSAVRDRIDRLAIPETPLLKYWGAWCDPQPEGPAAASILRYAQDHKPLIVFDSLVAFHDGSEQDASETRRFMGHFRALANAGATVVLIHHTGKAATSKEYRGSSDLKAAIDTGWLMEPLGGTGQLGGARLVPFKNRLGVAEPLTIQYSDGKGFSAGSRQPTDRDILEAIVKGHPGIGQKELIDTARKRGCSRDGARNLLELGEREAWLVVESGGKGGRKVYTLPDAEA